MIYTLTLAPAIDVYYQDPTFKVGILNRPKGFYYLPGGKGINVTRMLNNLGRDSIAFGFSGGLSGKFLEGLLKEYKVKYDFVETDVKTRINTKINGVKETEINVPRSNYTSKDYIALSRKILKIKKDDILVISGYMPNDLSLKDIESFFNMLMKKGIKLILDVTHDSLIKLIKYKPFLIKPNREELENFFFRKIKSENDIVVYARKLVNMGAENVIVSLGGDGALLVNKINVIRLNAPKGKVIKTVGSGDAMVAGFIDEYLASEDIKKAFKKSIFCGSATAFSIDLATKKEVLSLMNQII